MIASDVAPVTPAAAPRLEALPIIVGVTGHRDLRPEDMPALESAVRGVFERFLTSYPTTPLVLLTPLAVGADRLAARVAIAMGIHFRVPLPMPEAEYRRDFSPEENAEFDALLAEADERFTMPFVAGNDAENVRDPGHRARQYAMVGAYIARVSHVMIALWDGQPSPSTGGTAEVVDFRLTGAPDPYRTSKAILDPPDGGPVYHIMTPRQSRPAAAAATGTVQLLIRGRGIDPQSDPLARMYANIEQFNVDTARLRPHTAETLPTLRLRAIAERLATHFQTLYHYSLRIIFCVTGLAALMLAIAHDPQPRYEFAVAYTVLLFVALVPYVLAKRYRWQDRFIEYRALEFGLFVQSNWDRAGVVESVADVYLRLQRTDLDWIREAIRTMHHLGTEAAGSAADQIQSVRDFIEDQRGFFARAAGRDDRVSLRFERCAQFFFWTGVALTVVLGIVSLLHLTMSDASKPVPIPDALWSHSDYVIRLIAVTSIFAAVLHEYPRRRAFHAQARRYTTMFNLYDRALSVLDASRGGSLPDQLKCAQEVAREIGREALAENGDWVMMHRELPIEAVHL